MQNQTLIGIMNILDQNSVVHETENEHIPVRTADSEHAEGRLPSQKQKQGESEPQWESQNIAQVHPLWGHLGPESALHTFVVIPNLLFRHRGVILKHKCALRTFRLARAARTLLLCSMLPPTYPSTTYDPNRLKYYPTQPILPSTTGNIKHKHYAGFKRSQGVRGIPRVQNITGVRWPCSKLCTWSARCSHCAFSSVLTRPSCCSDLAWPNSDSP